VINNGDAIGVSAYFNSGIITLTWTVFALSSASSVVWGLAGFASAAFRDT
jgi:hypothetical protein